MDRDAADHMRTLEGEASMKAERLQRDAHDLRVSAVTLDHRADEAIKLAAWYAEAAEALES